MEVDPPLPAQKLKKPKFIVVLKKFLLSAGPCQKTSIIHKLLFSFQILAYCGKSTTNEGCYEKNHIGYGSQSPVYWTCTRIRRPNSHRLAARIIATTLSPLRVRFFVKSHGIIKDFSSTRCRKIRVKYVVFSYIFHPCKNYVLY